MWCLLVFVSLSSCLSSLGSGVHGGCSVLCNDVLFFVFRGLVCI